eukprot:5939773-Lingulodinium_polyedra.AAC.1
MARHAVLCHESPCPEVSLCPMPCHNAPCRAVQCCAAAGGGTPHRAMLCRVVPCDAVLYVAGHVVHSHADIRPCRPRTAIRPSSGA